jgi:hypothetical protein
VESSDCRGACTISVVASSTAVVWRGKHAIETNCLGRTVLAWKTREWNCRLGHAFHKNAGDGSGWHSNRLYNWSSIGEIRWAPWNVTGQLLSFLSGAAVIIEIRRRSIEIGRRGPAQLQVGSGSEVLGRWGFRPGGIVGGALVQFIFEEHVNVGKGSNEGVHAPRYI